MAKDRFAGPPREGDIRYKFDFELLRKALGCRYRLLKSFLSDFSRNKQICHSLCQIGIGKSSGWQSDECQIWIWFKLKFQGFRIQIEIVQAIFIWISKQQVHLPLFLSKWYCRKLGLTDLPSQDGTLTSHKKIILNSY